MQSHNHKPDPGFGKWPRVLPSSPAGPCHHERAADIREANSLNHLAFFSAGQKISMSVFYSSEGALAEPVFFPRKMCVLQHWLRFNICVTHLMRSYKHIFVSLVNQIERLLGTFWKILPQPSKTQKLTMYDFSVLKWSIFEYQIKSQTLNWS